MHRLSYHSHALVTGSGFFDDLYAQAARFNSQAGITGALMFIGGRWAQILEGDEGAITGLYDRIARDPRHERVTLDYLIETPGRLFPGWSMGRITDDEKADIPLARIIAATVAADSDTSIRQLRSLARAAGGPLSSTTARAWPGPAGDPVSASAQAEPPEVCSP